MIWDWAKKLAGWTSGRSANLGAALDQKAQTHQEVDKILRSDNPGDMNVKATVKYVGRRERAAVRILHARNRRRNAKQATENAKKTAHFHSFARHDYLVRELGLSAKAARRLGKRFQNQELVWDDWLASVKAERAA